MNPAHSDSYQRKYNRWCPRFPHDRPRTGHESDEKIAGWTVSALACHPNTSLTVIVPTMLPSRTTGTAVPTG